MSTKRVGNKINGPETEENSLDSEILFAAYQALRIGNIFKCKLLAASEGMLPQNLEDL